MCGICGIVHPDTSYQLQLQELVHMRDTMVHRGPDDAGYYVAPGIGLGSRRLSILDLSPRGHMPMTSLDGRYHIVHNGEIYNFQEHRHVLEQRGVRFRSKTDTEVLLGLYALEGPSMLARLNGIFAFAIWDARERTLFLARDHNGVKPLYYTVYRGALYFASEVKALLAAGVPAQFDEQTWEELFIFRYTAGEQTVFSGIKRLLPGHYLLWKNGHICVDRWWNLAERAKNLRAMTPAEPEKWYRQTFDHTIDLQRISDVPLGVLMSGGLDSSSVAAALAAKVGSGVASFTVRFSRYGYDEGPYAQQVAKRWNLNYHELELSLDELMPRLEETVWLNDEPFVHQNELHIWAISRFAKPYVTVLLSGEGGDETLGGYIRYQPLRYPWLLKRLRSGYPALSATLNLKGRLQKLGHFLAFDSLDRFIIHNASNISLSDLRLLGMTPTFSYPHRLALLAEAKDLYPDDPFRQAMYLDQHTFLQTLLDRNDRMTMGASIECRVPFLDYRLMEGLAALPSASLVQGFKPKSLLRRSLGDRLPEEVLQHRKWGFEVPWGTYLRQVVELRRIVQDLPDLDPVRSGPFDRRALKHVVHEFLAGQAYEPIVRQLFMIVVWHRVFFATKRWMMA
jgi:asparagine synthase (glutamine-hydrolysing)